MSNQNCENGCNKKSCKRWECCCNSIWNTCSSKPRYRTWNNKKGEAKILYCSNCEQDEVRFKDVECTDCKEIKACLNHSTFEKGKGLYLDIHICFPCYKIRNLESKIKDLEEQNKELLEMLNEKE